MVAIGKTKWRLSIHRTTLKGFHAEVMRWRMRDGSAAGFGGYLLRGFGIRAMLYGTR